MNVNIHEDQLKKEPQKVKRYGIFDGRTCKKICLTEEEAKALAEKWSEPHPFGFADEEVGYTYKEIWI